LETFEPERADTARQLIAFDTTFSHIFSGKIGSGDSTTIDLTHEEFLRVFREGNGFTSGCGLHYKPSRLVRTPTEPQFNHPSTNDPLSGALIPGRRLLNVEVKRYADATTRQLQDGTSYSACCQRPGCRLIQITELPSVGRYRIIVFSSNDLLDRSGITQSSLVSCIESMQKFPAGTIDLVVLHPLKTRFEWTDIPPRVKEAAEMRTYGLSRNEDAYEIYGVCKDKGLIAIIRPDGYVGTLAPLFSTKDIETYLRSCLILV
jgi:phenol 2-monooxygenase